MRAHIWPLYMVKTYFQLGENLDIIQSTLPSMWVYFTTVSITCRNIMDPMCLTLFIVTLLYPIEKDLLVQYRLVRVSLMFQRNEMKLFDPQGALNFSITFFFLLVLKVQSEGQTSGILKNNNSYIPCRNMSINAGK